MKVVFAPHAASSGPGITGAVEYEIKGEGIKAVHKKGNSEQELEGDEYEEDGAALV